jgi:hypothetical protein
MSFDQFIEVDVGPRALRTKAQKTDELLLEILAQLRIMNTFLIEMIKINNPSGET